MTITAERPAYVGSRRFADRPAEARAARHRATEPAAVALVAQLGELVLGAGSAAARAAARLWSATMSPRAVARLIVIVGVAVGLFLGFGALILHDPTPAAPREPVVTPSPTPSPGGWTYGT